MKLAEALQERADLNRKIEQAHKCIVIKNCYYQTLTESVRGEWGEKIYGT
ncbi:MAG: DIP1984 family protein [Lachnospiraceae bacterium]|nr:DIP1984 family protein [Lachnospiraceae bacterium]